MMEEIVKKAKEYIKCSPKFPKPHEVASAIGYSYDYLSHCFLKKKARICKRISIKRKKNTQRNNWQIHRFKSV